jgi:NCS1 family nucleobase:cation symporter-1
MVENQEPEDTEGPRRKTFAPPAEGATFTGSLPVMGDTDESGAPVAPIVPVIPAPTAAIAPPIRTSLRDEEILAKFRSESAGSTAEMINELEAQVTLREEEEEAFTMWANLTRATRGASAEEIITRERIVFDGGTPEPLPVMEDPLPEGIDDSEPEAEPEAEEESVAEEEPQEDASIEPEPVEPEPVEPEEESEKEPEEDQVDEDRWPLAQNEAAEEPEVVEAAGVEDEPVKNSVPVLDRTGLEPTAENQKVLSTAGLFWSWWATLTPVVGIIAGAFLVSRGLGLLETVVALGAAALLSGGLIAAGAYAGARTGLATLHTAQMTFGRIGNAVPSVLVLVIRLALVGLLALGAETLATRVVSSAGWWPFDLWILRAAIAALIAGIVVTLAILGGRALRIGLYVSAGFQALGILGFVVVTAPALSFDGVGLWSGSALQVIALGSLALSVLLVLFGHTGGDLARYHRGGGGGRSAVATVSGLVAVVPTILFVSYVALVAIGSPRLAITLVTDPVGTLAAGLPAWYPAPLLLGLVLPLIGLASLALFSGGLATLSAGVRVSRPVATSVFAVISAGAVAAAIAFEQSVAGYVPSLLYVAGVVLAAWGASFALDVALGAHRLDSVATGTIPAWRVAPLAGMVVGIAAGLGMITSSVAWLSWLGYLLPLLEMAGLIDLSAGQLGVLVALVVSGAVSAITALAIRSKAAQVAHG